jgi:hypothetical protein
LEVAFAIGLRFVFGTAGQPAGEVAGEFPEGVAGEDLLRDVLSALAPPATAGFEAGAAFNDST